MVGKLDSKSPYFGDWWIDRCLAKGFLNMEPPPGTAAATCASNSLACKPSRQCWRPGTSGMQQKHCQFQLQEFNIFVSHDSTNRLQRQGAVAAAASAPVAIEVLDHPDAKLHPGPRFPPFGPFETWSKTKFRRPNALSCTMVINFLCSLKNHLLSRILFGIFCLCLTPNSPPVAASRQLTSFPARQLALQGSTLKGTSRMWNSPSIKARNKPQKNSVVSKKTARLKLGQHRTTWLLTQFVTDRPTLR